MVMCSQCHKRMAVIFVTKVENGEKTTKGLCMKCAKEMGVPVDNLVGNVMGQLGISPEQLENAEEDLNSMLAQTETPSDCDDKEDGGAPAIDLPKLFRDAGLFSKPDGNQAPAEGQAPSSGEQKKDKKKEKEGEEEKQPAKKTTPKTTKKTTKKSGGKKA